MYYIQTLDLIGKVKQKIVESEFNVSSIAFQTNIIRIMHYRHYAPFNIYLITFYYYLMQERSNINNENLHVKSRFGVLSTRNFVVSFLNNN